MIELNRKNPRLFDEIAQEWAERIRNGRPSMKKNQIRNFYDKVLSLYEKSKYEEFEDILPFIKMLNSKVAYALNRKPSVANREFQIMMKDCISQINNKEKLETFKYFFEAVIGFYR